MEFLTTGSVVILFFVGIIAGFLNVSAGGGSTLTLPVLIFLGLDSSVANGTNRIAILIQNISAVYSFKKEKYQDLKASLFLSLFTLPGAIAGALLAVNLNDELFQKILAIIMIVIILTMFIPQKKTETTGISAISIVTAASMFGIGFYGGFIQVGVGFLIMASLKYLMKLNLVLVNMHKVFIVLVYTIPALIIFIITNNVNWFLGLSLAGGNALGGWWGAKVTVKKGEGFIKIILVFAILIMALKLLNVF
ncbi:MAG: sulfite exporter TauE/SafE family protein [Ignavibacteria bacterium]|nr:sulfite exporter TauE/SafE family protein [Ignavibacteria bacterium]MBT8380919.1 sulfite exporter TauE/SafE family protein [Ignavibacteria bacterium]MBT8391487.1 sulfite exporter TauE/SafE family protein [Ignavibacteria bacterium]NNJ54150.1 sulfite exporter TauE/SafE family protein [Ignavibacteriaceae bacterium]NNL20657.1 sulfite exporter TauE/SafE family protein [Ignavibacteriaceae bacterium]